MKKNIFLIFTATAMYSLLFYNQSPGFNHAVFTYGIIGLFAISNPSLLKSTKWIMAAIASALCATITGITGTEFNIVTNLFAMLVLSYVTVNANMSIITGSFYAGISSLTGLLFVTAYRVNNYMLLNAREKNEEQKFKWYYFILPFVALLFFLLLYRESSGAFKDLTNKIDLSFISAEWFVFTFIGYLFLFGLFIKPKEFDFLAKEAGYSNTVEGTAYWKTIGFMKTGLILFCMLDFLLLIVNLSDILYLINADVNHTKIPYAQLIHQGIGSLFVSLLLAVIFILVWFNQDSPKTRMNSILKILALVWVGLNMVLLLTNIYKNNLYIEAYGLTHLRVGVYFFLFLSFLTLCFCSYKIVAQKNNFYIYRRFGIAVLLLTILFNGFNWNKIICSHNIDLYASHKVEPDTNYLFQLGTDCLPMMVNYWHVLNPSNESYLNEKLDFHCRNFLKQYFEKDWRGLTFNDYHTFDKLKYYNPKTKKPFDILYDEYRFDLY